jgi:ELWxxDGT repeat protein
VGNRRVRAATITGSIAATAAIGLAASGGPAQAAGGFDASLVKDINPTGSSDPGDSAAALNGVLFFRANDPGVTGEELWRSDGTEAGTYLVKDINTNGSDGSNPSDLTVVGNTLFFTANDGSEGGGNDGYELWKSNGTTAGTQLVEDINSTDNSFPSQLTKVGSTLFFTAYDGPQGGGTHGYELWKSTDGTAANTTIVEDINTNALNASGNSTPAKLTAVGSSLFFTAYDGPQSGGTHGNEPWVSTDGTEGNTQLVEDINTGVPGNSYSNYFTDVGGTLFFSAYDGNDNNGSGAPNGTELWRSTDGTAPNTQLVKDIYVSGNGDPNYLTEFGGKLFFAANDGDPDGATKHSTELWMSDGTSGGTQIVANINPVSGGYPAFLTPVGSTLFFQAGDGSDNGTPTQHGRELWKTDGTGPGTQLVKDINPTSDSFPSALAGFGGTLFFQAVDGSTGEELWKSDGTDPGTELVKDINPGPSDSHPNGFTPLGGNLLFSADDGTNGRELWKAFALPPPPATTQTPAPTTVAPTFNLKAAIAHCKKKFPKGPKRKKCIRKAKAKAAL